MRLIRGLIVVVGMALCFSQQSLAETKTSNSEYKILIHGITLARLNFQTEWQDQSYRVTGDIKSSALGDIVAKTRGQTQVTGKIVSDRLQGLEYKIDYTTGDKRRILAVSFDEDGRVKSSQMEPAAEKPPEDWVNVKQEHLLSVVDPISSLTFPVKSADTPICGRTISIFDGETALDLKLSYKGHRRFSTKGFKGRAIACRVTFHPKGGYRSEHDSIKYLQRSKDMEVWFGFNKQANLYAPLFAKIPTKIGNVRVWASKFGV